MIDNKELAEMLIKIGEDLKLGNDNVHIRSYLIEPAYRVLMGAANINVSIRHELADNDIHYVKKLRNKAFSTQQVTIRCLADRLADEV